MPLGFLDYFLWRKQLNNPERLIDAVISDIKHQLTEARIQMLAADMAAKDTTLDSAASKERAVTRDALANLETTLRDLETKRNLLISRARDADARLAIEQALLAADRQPAQVALDLIAERTTDSESQADAALEVRRIVGGGSGNV